MRLFSRIGFELVRMAALLGLAVATVWPLRVAVADHLAQSLTTEGLERAIGWNPGESVNYIRLSALVGWSDPQKALELLQATVALNPLDWRTWIDMALRRELGGDFAGAERDLIRASEVNRQYQPRWSLTNFYYRRGDIGHFWLWAQRAADVVEGDSSPLFRLCDQVENEAGPSQRLTLRDPVVRANYLSYLLQGKSSEPIAAAARQVLRDGRDSDVPVLLTACDRLLEDRMVGQALELWNGLARTNRIPYGPFVSADAAEITNGVFAHPPTSQGFDWRVPENDGVSSIAEDAEGGLRLVFSGRQMEVCRTLWQYVPVQENSHYELEYRYSTAGIANGAGLAWTVEYPGAAPITTMTSPIPSAGNLSSRVVTFDTPAGTHLVRVGLEYRRAPGTTRIEGRIVLMHVGLRHTG